MAVEMTENMTDLVSPFMLRPGFMETKRFLRYYHKLESIVCEWFNINDLPADSLATACHSFFTFILNDTKETARKKIIQDQVESGCVHLTNTYGWHAILVERSIFSLHDWDRNPRMADAVRALVKNVDVFIRVIELGLQESVTMFLHDIYLMRPGINEDNYVNEGLPANSHEIFLFIKRLFNEIATELMLSASSTCKDDVVASARIAQLSAENKKMIDMLGEAKVVIEAALGREEKATAAANQAKDALEKYKSSNSNKAVNNLKKVHQEEIAALNRELKAKQQEIEELQARQELMQSRVEIMEAEAEYSSEEEENVGELTRNSALIFVAARASNAGVQRTYDKILNVFPNSKVMEDVPPTIDADAVVLLTKYMEHHYTYWEWRNVCKDHGVPCLHCNKQNIDLIIDMILNRKQYRS